ncbi:CIC11C00000004521 [Sungouiella intermedia]|uniref:CIC11C00000004521 n=1 Tax=Sungouiella intermedia TaxID=45354 RepID=A0A1L0DSJ5_9ASCO|nr:CIC11C00000004521 [[Candida] intermedia]
MNSTALKQPVKPTVYKEPAERNAGLGFASSILNGNTIEGGLRSLTYKSIYALKLVEELDTMRNALIQPTPELLRISEFDVISLERVQQLHSEIEEVKNAKTARNHANDEKILQFNLSLDTELDTNKLVSEQYSSEVKKYYLDMIPDMNVSFNNSTHSVTKIKCPVDITRMEDVEGFDKSIYERAAERRELEEKKRQEEEALRILEEERKRQEAEAAQAAQAAQAAADLVVAETADTRMHLDEDYLSYSASPSMDQLSPVVQDSPYLQAQSPY